MEFGQKRDLAQEYEDAAEFFAKEYGNGLTYRGRYFGNGLVRLRTETIDAIEMDPAAWESRVANYAYALAMLSSIES